jgi:UDP-N-acetylmuramoyl-L-alanyl-D-glutamate--2,6-diaminopimelate ligase
LTINIQSGFPYNFITDNSKECDKNGAYLLSRLNERYLEDAKSRGCVHFVRAKEVIKILGLDTDIKLIGITGTNGKTTTAAALYSLLLDLNQKVAMQGTRGFFINEEQIAKKSLTTPTIFETIKHIKDAKEQGCDYFITEVSSHAIVQNRIDGLDFALKIFTNVTQDHLDFHKSLENYIQTKSSFFGDESKKLINKDDTKIRYNKKNCMTYGVENPATYKVLAYALDDGISAAISKIEKVYEFSSPLHGFFNLYNILAAIGAADMLKIAPMQEICDVVENFAGVEGRMEIISDSPLIIVDFAHTPDGMEKVMDSLKNKDLVVVFGAGGDRDKNKRVKMGFIASKYAKKIIITSDNPRSEKPEDIIKDILEGAKYSKALKVEAQREKAISQAIKWQEKDEVLLVLGKGDETYQEINGEKIPFDDREIIRKLIGKIG